MSKQDKVSNIDDVQKDMQAVALDNDDVTILKLSSNSPYSVATKKYENDIQSLQESIKKLSGVEKADMGLSPMSHWDLNGDRERLKQMALTVARVTKILPKKEGEFRAAISIRQSASYLVGKHAAVSAEDIEEDMRVGVTGSKLEIALPLPAAVDPTVSLMQVDEKPTTTYADVGGCGPQLKSIREVVELPLLHPERFTKLGIQPPKSCILYGVPGIGKTLTARAIANKTNSCFIRILGSQLNQKYVGEGARLIREIFALAREKPSCILFFDECDSFASRRSSAAQDTGDSGVQRTMLELINQLDGFQARGNIFVLMASNRPDTLDEALLRPGRLDRRIEFKLPDLKGREEIFRIQTRRMAVESGIRFKLLARLCQDSSGAEIASVCREAGIIAMRASRKLISEADFTAAIDKVVKGYRKFVSQGKYLTANSV